MWNFENMGIEEAENLTKPNIEPLPVGDYRLRIENTEFAVSTKTSLPMIKITSQVSGTNRKIFSYIVLDEANKERTNANLVILFNSFGITPTMDIVTWIGKVGGGHIKQEPYNDKMTNKLSYFLKRSEVDKLPAWVEPTVKTSVQSTTPTYTQPANPWDNLEEILKD